MNVLTVVSMGIGKYIFQKKSKEELTPYILIKLKSMNFMIKYGTAFAVILPVKTVGVMGDARTYDYACALRAVTSIDGMTADYYPFTHDFLSETATRIINNVKGINRAFV